MSNHTTITCLRCEQKLRIPSNLGTLEVRCPRCEEKFLWDKKTGFNIENPKVKDSSKIIKPILTIMSVVLTVCLLLFVLFYSRTKEKELTHQSIPPVRKKHGSQNWVTISYRDLIDRSIITHSGNTVGDVIQKISKYPDSKNLKGLVQPYLEPFSFICNDIIAAINGVENIPLVNILSYYPVGSKQPAWVALFRQGHYQLHFNNEIIRVFLKGDSSETLYRKYISIIRHPIKDLFNSMGGGIKTVEVYAFKNNYAKTELSLDINPFIFGAENIDLGTKEKPIDIDGLQDFFKQGVIIEAAEVDKKNDFFLYGRRSNVQTVYGSPLSLSDLSVVYRSIFHYGHNAPYISLDKHEDNRYAKVNFGGLLENTRVGGVVLESDKLFKTLSVGLDPNTNKIIRNKINRIVPDFLTEDERSLLYEKAKGKVQIRYWFYPDNIGTETDGNIGVISSYQLLADVERMDAKVSVGRASRETIDHLNRNYSIYEKAFQPFKELSTIGRMMALVNWLQGMNMDKKVDLDALLSVDLPAFKTPKKTKKMLAITGIAHTANRPVMRNTVRNSSRVYYISNLLDKSKKTHTDDQFLKIAHKYFESMNKDSLIPKDRRDFERSLKTLDTSIQNDQNRLIEMEMEMEEMNRRINRYSPQYEVSKYNYLVQEYNALINKNKININDYNLKVRRLNSEKFKTYGLASIGGGINLRPKDFKKIIHNAQSAKIKGIRDVAKKLIQAKQGVNSSPWIRNNSQSGKNSFVHELPITQWKKNIDKGLENINKSEISISNGDRIWVRNDSNSGNWKYKSVVNGAIHEIVINKSENTASIVTEEYPQNIKVSIDRDQKIIILSKGGKRGQGDLNPPPWMEQK
jgi:DNA-directed RNA polymerase subunit RPC12/RpoP